VSDWKWYLIAVGLQDEEVLYKNIDVSLFDMNGISNHARDLLKKERRLVLESLIPANVLLEFDSHWFDIQQMKRIKKYAILKHFIWFVDRLIFKIEKAT
jgi:hypothetical protein